MRKFKLFPILLVSILVLSLVPVPKAHAAEELVIDATAAYLVELNTGDVLFAKNEHMKLFPASTTKVLTVLLAIEAIERGEADYRDMVTASDNCRFDLTWDSSTVGISAGESMSLENLMICALVASANEACNIIGEYIGGTVSSFVDLMNARAAELGCRNTHFANTHGLPNEDHYSSAYDLHLIAKEAIKHEKFMQMCNYVEYTVPATNMSDERHIKTTNELIDPASNYYNSSASGIKTGSTDAAGFCLVSSAEKNEIKLLSVILGAKAVPTGSGAYRIDSFTETGYMFRWVFANYSWREILSATELVAELPVALGEGMDSVIVHPESSLRDLIPNDLDINKEYKADIHIYCQDEGAEPLTAPISMGEELGEITLTYKGETFGPVKLVANTDVPLSKIEYMKSRIRNTFKKPWLKWTIIGILFVFLLYIAFIIRYNILKYRHKKKLQARREASERERR
ncbi:MAG: D-alanyl-D-alanine carboxypeptidase [Oscillospiraceae bacterium]|nr:D-alanyl-D-alanine carboxypeptidase [Oscillospiraceae bacterium]